MKIFTLQIEASFAATDIISYHEWDKDQASWWFGDVKTLTFSCGEKVWCGDNLHYSGNLESSVVVEIDEHDLWGYDSLDECLTDLGEDILTEYLFHENGPNADVFRRTLTVDNIHVYNWDCEDYNPTGWANEVIEKNKS